MHERCILHVDMDCFYAQVEAKRLGVPPNEPLAVQQWEGLIAVNYAARARGVTRHMRVAEARVKCPELRLVHVETLGGAAGEATEGAAADRGTSKACLERYRRACMQVLKVVHAIVGPSVTVEKASIDELYVDVTAMVDKELRERQLGAAAPEAAAVEGFAWGSIVLGGPLQVCNEFERRLAVAAGIACRIRGAIRSQVGFTCSAGIATTKLMAKLMSARNKPNQQTVLPPRAIAEAMQDMPLSKIRYFGGKLGQELAELQCSTAGQVLALPPSTLHTRFGPERAAFIIAALQGMLDEAVVAKERPKSMLAAKSFSSTSNVPTIARWLLVLAEELVGRMQEDEVLWQRRAKNLVLQYRGGGTSTTATGERSRSCAMPRCPSYPSTVSAQDSPGPQGTQGAQSASWGPQRESKGPNGPSWAQLVADAALQLLLKEADALPCSRVAISTTDFVDLAPPRGTKKVSDFFSAAVNSDAQAAGSPHQPGSSNAAHPPTSSGTTAAPGCSHADMRQQHNLPLSRSGLPSKKGPLDLLLRHGAATDASCDPVSVATAHRRGPLAMSTSLLSGDVAHASAKQAGAVGAAPCALLATAQLPTAELAASKPATDPAQPQTARCPCGEGVNMDIPLPSSPALGQAPLDRVGCDWCCTSTNMTGVGDAGAMRHVRNAVADDAQLEPAIAPVSNVDKLTQQQGEARQGEAKHGKACVAHRDVLRQQGCGESLAEANCGGESPRQVGTSETPEDGIRLEEVDVLEQQRILEEIHRQKRLAGQTARGPATIVGNRKRAKLDPKQRTLSALFTGKK